MGTRLLSIIGVICLLIGFASTANAEIIIEDAGSVYDAALQPIDQPPEISSRIIVEYASSIYDNQFVFPGDIGGSTQDLPSRIIVEYASSIYDGWLVFPVDINASTQDLPSRTIVEYATSIFDKKLVYPAAITASTQNLPSRIAVEYATSIMTMELHNPDITIDSDNDGIFDAWEALYPGLDPFNDDANDDLDNDGYTNYVEYLEGTAPNDATSIPTNIHLNEALAAFYPFNNNTNDESGNGNDGTSYGGAALTEDKFGNADRAFGFDGIDDYIYLDDPDTEENPTFDDNIITRTGSFWFRTKNAEQLQIIYEEGGGSNGINVYIHDSRVWIGAWSEDNSWDGVWVSIPTTSNEWHHVVYVFDSASSQSLKLYYNGKLETEASVPTQIHSHTGDDAIGAMINDTKLDTGYAVDDDFYFSGAIDDIRIYNRALSYAEIQTLYNMNFNSLDCSVNTHWYNWATTFEEYQNQIKNFNFVRDHAWWSGLEPADYTSQDNWNNAPWSYPYPIQISNCAQSTTYQSGYDELVKKFQSTDSPELLLLLDIHNNAISPDANDITYEQYYDYVHHIVERYDGDGIDDMPGLVRPVRYFEIGNEVDSRNPQHSHNLTIANYVNNRLIPAYLAAKDANPETVVMNAGLSMGGNTGFDTTYLQDMLNLLQANDGAQNNYYMDKAAIHYYCNPQNPEYFTQNIDQVKSIMETHNLGTKPVWITEFGIATKNDAGGEIREKDQASVLLRYFALMAAHDIERSFIYNLKDVNSSDAADWENVYGLLKVACQESSEIISEKESVEVLETFYRKIKGLCFESINPESERNNGIYKITFSDADNKVQILWYTAFDKTGINPDHSSETTAVQVLIGGNTGILSDMYGNIINSGVLAGAMIFVGERPQYLEYTNQQDIYTVQMSNVDDLATLYINDVLLYKAKWGYSGVEPDWNYVAHQPGDSGEFDISSDLINGENRLRFTLWNEAVCCSASLTIEVKKNGETIISDSFSAQDSSSGIKYDKTFIIGSESIDQDGDGMPNDWELANELNPFDPADASGDPDLDGLSNLDEYLNGTNPQNPDSDNDGLSDGDEVNYGSDPKNLDRLAIEVQNKDVLVSLTGNDRVFVRISNWFCLPRSVQFELAGLDPEWYTIDSEDQAFTLLPYSFRTISIQLHLPPVCDITTGAFPFDVTAHWQHDGTAYTSMDQGDLLITPNPNVYNLAIPENTRLGGNSILTAWKTDIPTTSDLYYRKLGDAEYTQVQVAIDATEHRYILTDLEWFEFYEFYIENHAACDGYTKSGPYIVKTGKAVKFENSINEFTIDRDYNQLVTMTINNTDVIEHTYQMSVVNDNEDLVVDFVGNGSNGREAGLQPGESTQVELALHAPDAQKSQYDIYLKMVSDDGDGNAFVDYSHTVVHVRLFVANLDIQPVESTPGMMTYSFNLINYGDTLSDIEVYVDDDNRLITWMEQEYHHLRLENGEFRPIVIHAQEHTTGTIYVRSGDYVISAPFEIGCPDGTTLNTYTINDLSIVAEIKDWYCTNKKHLELPFAVPRGFSHEDLAEAAVEVNFSLPMSPEKYDPHTVIIYINGNQVATIEDTIPEGKYTFRIPTSFINLGYDAPAGNLLKLEVEDIGEGQYIIATDFRIIMNIDKMDIDLCVPGYIKKIWEILPEPETKITRVEPLGKYRPDDTAKIKVHLYNNDTSDNSHSGLLTISITNNSYNGAVLPQIIVKTINVPPGTWTVPDDFKRLGLDESDIADFDCHIPDTADDIEYTISATFENSTRNITDEYLNHSAFYVRTPLIIIHGIMGSTLKNTDTNDTAWFSLGDFDQLACNPDGSSVNNISATQTIIEVLKLESLNLNIPIVSTDIFDGLQRYLNDHAYKIHPIGVETDFNIQEFNPGEKYDEDVFYFVYDWRMDNLEKAVNLKEFVGKLTQKQGSKVNIVAHSMGGVLAKSLLSLDPSINGKINKLIFLGTPHVGAVEAFSSIKYGDNKFFIGKSLFREVSANIASSYQLLPSQKYFDYYQEGYYVLNENPLNSYEAMKNEMLNSSFTEGLLQQAEDLHSVIDSDDLPLPPNTYNIVGCRKCTTTGIVEDGQGWEPVDGDGDETVPLQSALAINIDASKKYAAQYAKHSNLPSQMGVKFLVRSLLKGYETGFKTDLFHPVAVYNDSFCGLPDGFRIKFDFDGNSGLDWPSWPSWPKIITPGGDVSWFTGNGIHIGILGSDYRITNDGVEIFVPEGSIYTLEFKGVDAEYVNIKFEMMTEGGIIKTYVFFNIPLNLNGNGAIDIDLTNMTTDPVLRLDQDGDGNFETENIPPSYILDETQSGDNLPPLTTASITGTTGGAGWYLPDVSISLAATDNAGGSGLSATYYRLQGDTNFTEYTDPIVISEIGKHTLTFYSIDRNLNRETNKTLEFTIDNGPPQVISATPSNLSSGAECSTNIRVVFSEMMDVSLLTESNITVSGSITGIHDGSISYDSVTNILTFDPDTEFMLQEDVIMTISGEIADMPGITLDGNGNDLSEGSPPDDYTFSFIINESDGLIVRISELTPIFCPTIQPVVIVTDENGEIVPDLPASAFTLYEDHIAYPLLSVDFVNLISSPVSVSLALDYSGSMGSTAINDMEDAAAEFINNMIEEDAGEIIKFANGVETMQEFTTDTTDLIDAVYAAPTIPNSSTSLYDAVYQAVTASSAETGRKAVIVMTDGKDTSSSHNDSEVIAYAQTNEIPVFTIGLGTSINATVLEAIAEQTGGLYYEAPASSDLQAIYQSISSLLKNQYIIRYNPAIQDGLEHTLQIVVNSGILSGSDKTTFISCLDLDNDGLPDNWEQQIIDADPGDDIDNIAQVLPGDDFDGDGFCNLREYMFNTDPVNSLDIPVYLGDFFNDGDVDGSDLFYFTSELGNENCSVSSPCDADFNYDNLIDGLDLLFFSEDFGRIDCP